MDKARLTSGCDELKVIWHWPSNASPKMRREDLCFEAEQAVEKAVKAVLRFRGIDFPRTHDIGELLALLDRSGQKIPQYFWKADSLTAYAVETRYPGPAEPVTRNEHRRAVALAEKVVKWAENIVLPRRRK